MNKKFTDKDKKDWENFINSKDKIFNKDLSENKNTYSGKGSKTIDLHGSSLETANKIVSEHIKRCSSANIKKLVVITGKGLRSNTRNDPYVSKDLSILKYSVPEFIKSNSELMKIIKKIEDNTNNKNSGFFTLFLKIKE